MPSVVVTGGSGKAGRAAISEFLLHGYNVLNVDVAPPQEAVCHFLRADLTDFGEAVDALQLAAGTIDRRRAPIGTPAAVVHMAGIPAPGLASDATVFQNNLISTYNVFSAATRAGLCAGTMMVNVLVTYGTAGASSSPSSISDLTLPNPAK